MVNLERTQEQRRRFLRMLYEETRGNRFTSVSTTDIAEKLGFTQEEYDATRAYLTGQDWMKIENQEGDATITTAGITEAERAMAVVHRAEMSPPAAPTMHFYSPVGAVLTGERATASVVQHLGEADRAGMVKALDALREELAAQRDLPETTTVEVLELIDEGRTELLKSAPNGLRVAALLNGVATAVQAAAALQPAYQAMKIAAAALGLSLP